MVPEAVAEAALERVAEVTVMLEALDMLAEAEAAEAEEALDMDMALLMEEAAEAEAEAEAEAADEEAAELEPPDKLISPE